MRHHDKIDAWNIALTSQVAELQAKHPHIAVRIFPTHALFSDIFQSPGSYGFSEADVGKAYGGKIWMDGLHPTSAVHSIIADRLLNMLKEQP